MDRQLAAAVIASFRDSDAADHRIRLRSFSVRRWQHSLYWLDASGLALYWLKRLQLLNIEDAVPGSIRLELKQRHADNRQRTAALFEEFARLNAAFHNAGFPYVNLKGFGLVPDYCPDITLRYQMDFDFLVGNHDAAKCHAVLNALGYAPVAINRDVLEFKTDAGRTPSIRDLYKTRPQRAVEIHLSQVHSFEFHPALLGRNRCMATQGGLYPCLLAEDMFIAQACHILRHLRSEWTRLSWLLEFKNCIDRRRDDNAFWRAVRDKAALNPTVSLAVNAAARIVSKTFGVPTPVELTNAAGAAISADVALWIECYGNDALLADFPGSKLYLILEGAIAGEKGASRIRDRLFPRRPPAPIVPVPPGRLLRLWAFWTQFAYFYVRLRFHITAGLRYFFAARHWRHLRAQAAQGQLHCPPNCITNTAR